MDTVLYHGSKRKFVSIKAHKPSAPDDAPELEKLWAVYLTSSFRFALLCASAPEGVTTVEDDEVVFEHPEKFRAEREVYVHVVDLNNVPPQNIIWVDEHQVAVMQREIKPVRCEKHLAGEILQHYRVKGIS